MAAADSPRIFLYVTAHLDEADHTRDDLELFLGRSCELFPAWEALPGDAPSSGALEVEPPRLCGQLARRPAQPHPHRRAGRDAPPSHRRAGAEEPTIIVSPILALMQPVPSHDTLERNTLHLAVGPCPPRTPSPQSLTAWAVATLTEPS